MNRSVFGMVVVLCLSVSTCWAVTSRTSTSCDGVFIRPAYKTRGHYCTPGQMVHDAYDFGKEVPCEEMEVDHLISLRQAWDSGVCGDDLKRLANDPRNLKFTHWRTNRAKGYLQPDVFARSRSSQVSQMIIRDAEAVMKAYQIRTNDQIVADRIVGFATNSARYSRVSVSALSNTIRTQLVYKQVGGRTIAFVGKRAIGYTLGIGVGVEAIMAAGWAADWLTSPTQDDRMRDRAAQLKDVLEKGK